MAKQLKCQNCGAPINRARMVCEYCGTQYERQYGDVPVTFMVDRPDVHRLVAKVKIDEEAIHRIPPEIMEKVILDKLRHSIADGLLEYMDITAERDVMSFSRVFHGSVRIHEPLSGKGNPGLMDAIRKSLEKW